MVTSRGKYTFNRKKFESYDEVDKEIAQYRQQIQELKKYRKNRDSMLLGENEVLGETDLPEHLRDVEHTLKVEEERQKAIRNSPSLNQDGSVKKEYME